MSRRRAPGEPTPRQLYAKEFYLSMGAGRSLSKLLAELERRRQKDGIPPACRRLRTLERWCSQGDGMSAAVAYGAQQAAKRAELLDAEQRRQTETEAGEGRTVPPAEARRYLAHHQPTSMYVDVLVNSDVPWSCSCPACAPVSSWMIVSLADSDVA
jgi:hypothetical protein